MKLLAIETSTNACSVAVQVGGEIYEQHAVEPRRHTQILLPMIRQALQSADIETGQLDAVVLGNGPGSFIGMRIGASVAQGVCYAAGVDIVPISSLAALAAEVFTKTNPDNVVIAQDARMSEIYVGFFERGTSANPVPIGAERIVPIGAVAGLVAGSTVAGGAWQDYPQLVEANRALIGSIDTTRVPRARYLLSMGAENLNAGQAIAPQVLAPAYLREQVAKPSA